MSSYTNSKHSISFIRYDVMGGGGGGGGGIKASTKWRKYMETCMFLCLHVTNQHENTKTHMFPCIFSI